MSDQYRDDECLNALRKTAAILEKSPTRREFRDLCIRPSANTIVARFGSWNRAKREAGLSVNRGGRKPKPVREDFFKEIDDSTSAYWLGFLYGDGSMVAREYGYRVQLTIRMEDREHLLKFKRTIRSQSQLVEDENALHLRVGDAKFAKHLRNQRFTTTKGTDGPLPDISTWRLKRAFVRGLADADGYYGFSKWTITDANQKRLSRLQSWIPVDSVIAEDEFDGRSWAYLRVSQKHELVSLYCWLFPRLNMTTPAMGRKRQKALSMLYEVFSSDS